MSEGKDVQLAQLIDNRDAEKIIEEVLRGCHGLARGVPIPLFSTLALQIKKTI